MNRLNAKYKAIVKSKKKALWFSFINALLLLLVCYFADNLRYSIFSGPSVGQRIEQFREIIGVEDQSSDEYIFINIAYDRELVSVFDEYGLEQGKIDITDRGKLFTFLSHLGDSHKYILMDVLLSNQYISVQDSVLTEAILNTDRIVVTKSSTTDLIDERLSEKAGFTDYTTNIYETNFIKYEFIKDGEPTMPYMVYTAIEPHPNVYSFGPFYWSNWHFCWSSLTLRFPIKGWSNLSIVNDENLYNFQEKWILNLGADILDMGIDIPALVRDKIVVIGDYTEDDIHDTYLGKIAGPIINVNALEALRRNEWVIPWTLIFIFWVVYAIVAYLTIRQPISANKLLDKLHLNTKIVKYFISFIRYSFLFTFVSGITYLMSGIDINIMIPSLWFTFLRGYTNTFAL